MRWVLVGKRDGKRVINWAAVLLTGVVVGSVSGLGGALTWFLLTRELDLFAALLPVFMFVGYFLGNCLRDLTRPLEELPDLNAGPRVYGPVSPEHR